MVSLRHAAMPWTTLRYMTLVLTAVRPTSSMDITLKARAASSSASASQCGSALLGHASSVTTCSRDGICKKVLLSAERPLPHGYSSNFKLKDKGDGLYAITATVDNTEQCIKPQMCGSRPSMYECSGSISFGSKDAWRIIEHTTDYNTKLYRIVNDACTSTALTLWLPNTNSAAACELAFPSDPAGGACKANNVNGSCIKITGSPLFDLWEIPGFESKPFTNGVHIRYDLSLLAFGAVSLLLALF